jgi:hypothetical protein
VPHNGAAAYSRQHGDRAPTESHRPDQTQPPNLGNKPARYSRRRRPSSSDITLTRPIPKRHPGRPAGNKCVKSSGTGATATGTNAGTRYLSGVASHFSG